MLRNHADAYISSLGYLSFFSKIIISWSFMQLIQEYFRSQEMHSKKRYRNCICSVNLVLWCFPFTDDKSAGSVFTKKFVVITCYK